MHYSLKFSELDEYDPAPASISLPVSSTVIDICNAMCKKRNYDIPKCIHFYDRNTYAQLTIVMVK